MEKQKDKITLEKLREQLFDVRRITEVLLIQVQSMLMQKGTK